MKNITINIKESYLSFLLSGQKTKEIRLNKKKFSSIQVGDILKLKNHQVQFKIIDKKILKNALNTYYKFYTKEIEKNWSYSF